MFLYVNVVVAVVLFVFVVINVVIIVRGHPKYIITTRGGVFGGCKSYGEGCNTLQQKK